MAAQDPDAVTIKVRCDKGSKSAKFDLTDPTSVLLAIKLCLAIDDTNDSSFNTTGPVASVAKFRFYLVLTWMENLSRGLGDLFHSESFKKDLEQHFIDAITHRPQETNMLEAKQLLLEVLEGLRGKYQFDEKLLEPLSSQVQRQSKGHTLKAAIDSGATDEEIEALADSLDILTDPIIMANFDAIHAARSGGA